MTRFDKQIENIKDPDLLVRLLLEQGESVSKKLKNKIVSTGPASIPALINLLNNEAIQMEDAPGGGWAPIHAVDLLKELKAKDAIKPMLKWLLDTDPDDDILHLHLITALSSFGQIAYQDVLDAFDQTDDEDVKMSLCDVLVESGVKSERIFNILLGYLHSTVDYGAMCFAIYGDKKAIPHLQQALDNWQFAKEKDDLLANQEVIELCAAIDELGEKLTPDQQRKLDQVKLNRQEMSSKMEAFFGLSDEDKEPKKPKLGRNDPCWCGSGKKYKKCHWFTDQKNFN